MCVSRTTRKCCQIYLLWFIIFRRHTMVCINWRVRANTQPPQAIHLSVPVSKTISELPVDTIDGTIRNAWQVRNPENPPTSPPSPFLVFYFGLPVLLPAGVCWWSLLHLMLLQRIVMQDGSLCWQMSRHILSVERTPPSHLITPFRCLSNANVLFPFTSFIQQEVWTVC